MEDPEAEAWFGVLHPPPHPLIDQTFLLFTPLSQHFGFLVGEEAAVAWFAMDIIG